MSTAKIMRISKRLMPDPTNAMARLSACFRFSVEYVSLELNNDFLNWTNATDVPKSAIPANKNSRAVSTKSKSPKVSSGSITPRTRYAANTSMVNRLIEILKDL